MCTGSEYRPLYAHQLIMSVCPLWNVQPCSCEVNTNSEKIKIFVKVAAAIAS